MSPESNPSARSARSQMAKNVAGLVLLLATLAILGIRLSRIVHTPGEPRESEANGRNGLTDFRDVIYYPLQAVLDGVNPYDCDITAPLPNGQPRYRQRYPVFNIFPLYSPLVLILHSPLCCFDFATSAAIFVVSNLLMVLALAYVAWRCIAVRPSLAAVTTLTSIILATNAGRANFLGGETALPLALATSAAAFYCRRRSGRAGIALAIASFKPTFGLPLGILLLAARDVRSVALGWGLGFVIGAGGLMGIFYRSGDLHRMPEILQENQQVVESEPHVDPRQSAARVDAAGALESSFPPGRLPQLAAALTVLGLSGVALWWIAGQNSLATHEVSRTIICLATVGSMYHSNYDAVLLWPAIVSLAYARPAYWRFAPPGFRPAVLACLVVPMVNVLPSPVLIRMLERLGVSSGTVPAPWPEIGWSAACHLNGVSLLVALGLLAWQSWRLRKIGPAPI